MARDKKALREMIAWALGEEMVERDVEDNATMMC